MSDLDELYTKWTEATAKLKWGVAKTIKDILIAAQDDKTTLIYGSDYGPTGAYISNAIGVRLSTTDLPSTDFNYTVILFDKINSELYMKNVNDKGGKVSRLAADILLTHFADISNPPVEEAVSDAMAPAAFETGTPRQSSDADTARDLAELFISTEAPAELHFNYNHIDRYRLDFLPQREATFEE